ncbi:MAG: glutamate-1-semialdehyde 2,1-aminomutase [Myxococcales bacterium]|nr:glutamate-1-semialdehyde 2,1-aminomutase [Myxococcales bacterium]
MNTKTSEALFERANAVIPGGVNSPVRACSSVGAPPLFITHGDGCHVYSADGDRYIDLIGSWGPLILGHAHSDVLDAVKETLSEGTSFGAPTEAEVEFAEVLCEALPSLDKVRAVNSGTEATMTAVRLARGFTGRNKLIKVDGGYHGHADFLLVAAGSGAATLGIPGSAGVSEGAAQDTVLVPYNDLAALEKVFEEMGDEVAAIIIEPVAGNMGVVPPADGYLQGIRDLTTKHGALFIMDEVMTSFRVAYGCAQGRYDVKPDLTCLGKVVGGGLPLAAFGGRGDIMDALAPVGPVYQAGTLSGNPLAVIAGLKTLELLRRPQSYERLEELGARLEAGLLAAAKDAGIPACINRVGSMQTLFFQEGPVANYDDAKKSDTERFAKYFRAMRERGVFLPPSQFEAMFLSLAHSDEEVDEIIAAARESMASL